MRFGVAVARRGWCRAGDIVNTRPVSEFLSFLGEEGLMADAVDGQSRGQEILGDPQAIHHLKKSIAEGRTGSRRCWSRWPCGLRLRRPSRGVATSTSWTGRPSTGCFWLNAFWRRWTALLPEEAKRELLFTGDVSGSVSGEGFKDLLGHQKYSAYLNYWYGVVIEEAVVQCVEEEEWKRIHSGGVQSPSGVTDLAFRRVYGLDQDTLLKLFREKKGYPASESMTLTEIKEFTYWLFKYRLQNSEGARVASDTRKGILFLEKMRQEGRAR